MAKKKKPASTRDAAPLRSQRKEPYTAVRVAAVVERLREQAARLAGLARALEDSAVSQIVVDGHAMLLRGMNQIDNFTDNAARAVREARAKNSPL